MSDQSSKLSDHARQLALQTVVSDPHLLWEILSPDGPAPLIFGPWVPARETNPDGSYGGGVWRKPPGQNKVLADGAVVRKARPLSCYEPRDPYDYDDEGDYDDAVEKYEHLVRVWKPFVSLGRGCRIQGHDAGGHGHGGRHPPEFWSLVGSERRDRGVRGS